MKRCILLAILLLLGSGVAQAGPDEWTSLFSQAQTAYDAGHFDAAVSLYAQLEQEGHREPEVLFNKGNALYRAGKAGHAIASYRRAQYERPRDPDIRANLSVVQQQVGAIAPEVGSRARLFGYFSQREWRNGALFFYWLAGGLGVVYLLARRALWIKRLAWIALALALFSGAGWWNWQQLRTHPEAVIIRAGTQALFAPMAGALVHFALPEGSLVQVREVSGAWRKVAVGRQEGWILSDSCEQLSLP
jgi:tetratricopeptide (TPR) repeat protein